MKKLSMITMLLLTISSFASDDMCTKAMDLASNVCTSSLAENKSLMRLPNYKILRIKINAFVGEDDSIRAYNKAKVQLTQRCDGRLGNVEQAKMEESSMRLYFAPCFI